MSIRFGVLVLSLVLATTAYSSEKFIVQGEARGPAVSAVSPVLIYWTSDALFYNAGASDATIAFLGVSNGSVQTNHPSFSLPSHRSTSLKSYVPEWRPGLSMNNLWIVRVDVPDDVVTESLLFIGTISDPGFGAPPTADPQRYGKIRLPVFTSLVPAGQPQVHLGTYLGDPVEFPSRINVGIYNAAAVAATAQVEVRNSCDDRMLSSTVASVPPDSVIQVFGLSGQAQSCPLSVGSFGGPINGVYTVVTLDQPGLSFVSNLANTALPITSISITPTP